MKRILTLITCVTLVSSIAYAQTSPTMTVKSNPSGAVVQLMGEATVTAVTPATINYPFIGEYNLTIEKYLYEPYKTRVVFVPGRQMNLDVELTPKTKFKATVRSIFVPGWGQAYTGQTGKEIGFMGLTAVAVTLFFVADHQFSQDKHGHDNAVQWYDDAVARGDSYNTLSRLQADVQRTQDRAYDSETTRRMTIGAVVGIWALNVVDAMFFTPTPGDGALIVEGVSVSPQAPPGTLGLTLSAKF